MSPEIVELLETGGSQRLALIVVAGCLLCLTGAVSALQVGQPSPATSEKYSEHLQEARDLLREGQAKKAIKQLQKAAKEAGVETPEVVALARGLLQELPEGPASDEFRILLCHAPLFRRQIDDPPILIQGDVQKPEKIFQVAPQFGRGKQGVVVLQTIIDKEGCIGEVKVLKGTGGLGEKTVEAIKKWVYRPATLNGKPVAVHFNLTMNMR